jgi:glutaredoxin
MRSRALATALAVALLAAPACGKKGDDGTSPVAAGSLPPLVIKDDSPELMLTWIDDKGDTHVELHPDAVPAAGRALVRVIVADKEAGTRDLFYVADLTKKRDDGSYETRSMRRRAWEDEIEKRREGYLVKQAPPPRASGSAGSPGAPPAEVQGAVAVIIYGASWCRPCHEAHAYLKKKGVKVVMKDVEETPGAAEEMQGKLRQAGRGGGSIPVIDVRGQILVGYDPSALDRALAQAGAGTTL